MTLLAEADIATDAAAYEPTCYARTTNEWFCGAYWDDRQAELIDATTQHIQITVSAVLLGLVIALPMAVAARRFPRLKVSILGLSTALYTIPSIALFPILVLFTGITMTTVIIGLALYSLTILVRNALTGLEGVPDDVRESATGLGYGATRMLFKIELPLALPVIMAGLRVATVSTVALVTVGALVSYGGLGELLKDGVETSFKAEIMAASLLCVLLALVFDVILLGIQWLLTPWSRSRAV
ncbi:MAG TPA: ABC transporter permease [Nocardioidaceae bacterium]|nr:ABC transporter permease [Nocardioidaceae bacterium]